MKIYELIREKDGQSEVYMSKDSAKLALIKEALYENISMYDIRCVVCAETEISIVGVGWITEDEIIE